MADDRPRPASLHLQPLSVLVDAGIDDAVALAVLVGSGVPLAQVIATEGSVALAVTGSVTARLLASIGARAVPVRLGARTGLTSPYPRGRDPFHGEDGFGGFARQLAEARPPSCRAVRIDGPVFASAALTVLAEALRRGDRVSSVLWMGGADRSGGNMTAAAEFNAWMDPAAANEVLSSGIPVSMVPLDVTLQCRWRATDIEALSRLGAAGGLLSKPAAMVCDRDGAFVPHDAVAAVALLRPGLFHWSPRYVRCEARGTVATGATIVDRRPQSPAATVLVAEDCDASAVRAEIFELIAGLG